MPGLWVISRRVYVYYTLRYLEWHQAMSSARVPLKVKVPGRRNHAHSPGRMGQGTWPDPSPSCHEERMLLVSSPPPMTSGYGEHDLLQNLLASWWTWPGFPGSGGIGSHARADLARPYKAARCSKPHRSSPGASPSPTAERASYIDFLKEILRASWHPQMPHYWSNRGPLQAPPVGCGVLSLAAIRRLARDASSSHGEDEDLS